MYQRGQGVEQSDQKAFQYYEKAAEQGDSFAQNRLGLMYQREQGVEQSDQKAFQYYEKAAEQGDSFL